MNAVNLKDVSKCYLVYESPTKALLRMVAPKMVVPEEVWALRDINLEVKKGECLGIIGNNGSGKSTLLAVIGGIISPTSGEVATDGRLSTLLDLTVGMQMELSGADNVAILGGILGLTREEIQQRSRLMIDFSELDDAINRPVKTYSTGMTMRLGFAVALHVDFDVLIVDEVLAVGDSNFHRKCIHRLRDLHINGGKTIIIASHGLGEIANLTDKLLLLDKGEIIRYGQTEEVLEAYWQECERQRSQLGERVTPLRDVNPYGDDLGDAKIEMVRFLDGDDKEREEYDTGESVCIEIWFNAVRPIKDPLFRVQIFRNDGTWVHGMNSARHNCLVGRVRGRGCMRLYYDQINLLEGDYYVSVGLWPDEYTSFITDVAYDVHEMGYVLKVSSERHHGAGVVLLPARWSFFPPGWTQTREAREPMVLDGRLPPETPGEVIEAPEPPAPEEEPAPGNGEPPEGDQPPDNDQPKPEPERP